MNLKKILNLAGAKKLYDDLRDRIKATVAVQDTEPTSEDNKLWVDTSNTPTEVQVPSYSEFTELSSAISDTEKVIAPLYEDLSLPIEAGKICFHDGKRYVCISSITTAEEWNPSHWAVVQITVTEQIKTLANDIYDKMPQPSVAGTAGQVLTEQGGNRQIWADPVVQDVQVNGTSILSQGVANVPIASTSIPGAVIVGSGLRVTTANKLIANPSGTETIKSGTEAYNPIVPSHQHESAFYGLAKAAGADMKNSSNAVGTYTEDAKSSISQMLDAPETVSGTTPSITGKAGIRYVCGECATLTITAPASGIIDVTFESGSTPTVLTVTPPTGMTMKWIGDDPTALEANKTYEVNIKDGCLGMVVSWT